MSYYVEEELPTDHKPFICSYPFNGDEYSVMVYARDAEEAKGHLQRIGTHGRVDGEFITSITAAVGHAGANLFVRAINWLRGPS